MREVLSAWLPARGVRSRVRRRKAATRAPSEPGTGPPDAFGDASSLSGLSAVAPPATAGERMQQQGERGRLRSPALRSSAGDPRMTADAELESGNRDIHTCESSNGHGSATEFESANGHGSGEEVESERETEETDAELTALEASTNASSLSTSEPCLRPATLSGREQSADKVRATHATCGSSPETAIVHELAGQAGHACGNRPPRVESQSEFRKHLFREGNRDKLLRAADGCLFRVYPMVMNGDCGFAAIAKGVTLHALEEAQAEDSERRRERSNSRSGMSYATSAFLSTYRRAKEVKSQDIRRLMAEEVSANRPIYSAISSDIFTDSQLTTFVKNVVRPGIAGHWLGAEIGGLEFVAVARALNITLALYCFDVPSQTVRRFEEAKSENPKYEICLFFAGPATCGHFDLLSKVSPPQQVEVT